MALRVDNKECYKVFGVLSSESLLQRESLLTDYDRELIDFTLSTVFKPGSHNGPRMPLWLSGLITRSIIKSRVFHHLIVCCSESRYLLILTENYAALGILQQELLKIKDAIIIFGSSFPKDQEYTQVPTGVYFYFRYYNWIVFSFLTSFYMLSVFCNVNKQNRSLNFT
jgi:hypothetical protein